MCGFGSKEKSFGSEALEFRVCVYSGSNYGDPKCLKRFGRKFKDFSYLLSAESGVRSARGAYAFVFRVLVLRSVLPSFLAHLAGTGCTIFIANIGVQAFWPEALAAGRRKCPGAHYMGCIRRVLELGRETDCCHIGEGSGCWLRVQGCRGEV